MMWFYKEKKNKKIPRRDNPLLERESRAIHVDDQSTRYIHTSTSKNALLPRFTSFHVQMIFYMTLTFACIPFGDFFFNFSQKKKKILVPLARKVFQKLAERNAYNITLCKERTEIVNY